MYSGRDRKIRGYEACRNDKTKIRFLNDMGYFFSADQFFDGECVDKLFLAYEFQ